MSRRRSTVSRWKSTALAAVLCVAATTATEPATQRQLVDRDGVAFSTPEAFCAIHCKPWRRRNRELTQCTRELCPQHFADTRELLEQANSYGFDETKVVSKINVLTCGSVGDSSHISFHIDADSSNDAAEQQLVFGGFYEAFFRAFDAMVTSENATVEACQLQWLQTELLPTASTSETTSTTLPKPMLVKFHRDTDQRACFSSIKTLWTDDDESFTPFLSHQDTNGASASVLLLHITDVVATQINALDCVSSVVQLPVILKMLPFARSAFQLRNRVASTTPAMRIRVIKGANPQDVLTRLQSKLTAIDGATNVFALPDRADLFPRSFFVSALPHLELWAHAVALAVADDEVEWVDERHEITHQTLRTNAYQMKPAHRRLDTYIDNLVGVKQAQDLGILGDGVIVGITDSGLYINHDQFDQTQRDIYKTSNMDARKVVYYNPWADQYDQSADVVCGHGTHVSGILAGSSYSKQASDIGVAPNSRIAFMDIGTQDSTCLGEKGCAVQLMTPAQASQLLQSQIDVGAKIFSFSWGTEGSDYSVQARQLDEYVYNNPEILIVVAAGNSGENSVTGQGTISSPSGAKNVISVGASLNSADSFENNGCPSMYNPGSVASFSSAGPTSDGRMKPDVVAPGMILVSSKSERPTSTIKSKDTCELQGTSQATPVVTGMAVLLSQWLRDGWWKSGKMDKNYGMKTIPAALLKALIIHSGDSLQRRLARVETQFTSCTSISNTAYKLSYPDVYQGYGKPNMSNIADFSSQSTPTLYFLPNSTEGSQPSVADGKEMRISFTVPRGVDLRATIVWTDPPGTVYATTQLQHDLDLSVQIRNSTKVFYPLTADNSTKRDSKNNIEMVVVTYQQLLSALAEEGTQSKLVGADGSIIVEAIIYGRSVLQAKAQTFAFVASSSVIGSTTGSAGIDGTSGAATNRSDSFWTPWTIGGIGAGALVLLALVAMSVRCCTSKKHRHAPGSRPGDAAYHNHTTPAAAGRRHGGVETCPYCAYASNDPVVMVNHVENMHNGINAPVIPGPGAGFGLPVVDAMQGYPPMYTAPHPSAYPGGIPLGHHVPNARPDERCPYCSFSSADPVILVNHVEHVHGEQRFI